MDEIVRKNFTARCIISIANSASKQKVWKINSPNMDPAYSMCKAALTFEIDTIKTVTTVKTYSNLISMQGLNYTTAEFGDVFNTFPVVIPPNVTSVQFVLSNPALVELVSFSTFVPGCDSCLKAVFIKDVAPAISVDQDLGTLKVIFETVDGGTITSPTIGLAAAEAYASTIPPAAPSNVVATKMTGPLRAVISWTDNSNNETGFRLYKILGNGSPVFINGVGPGVTTYTDTTGYAGDVVKYEVKSYNGFYSAPGVSNQITL